MPFTADHVWALAVVADRINGGYAKEDQYVMENECLKKIKEANKTMVKQWLREGSNPTTEADITEGQRVRSHFKSYTFLALAGKLNDFQHQAMKIAAKDEFMGRDLLDFAIISCLPDVARRDQVRKDFMQTLYASKQIPGSQGQEVQGEITVISSRFNVNYNKFKITARMGESFVDFWFARDLPVSSLARIRGKIKQQRDDKSTQLNYVKVLRG